MIKKIILTLVIVAAAGLLAARFLGGAPQGAAQAGADGMQMPPPPQVNVAAAISKEIQEFREFSGHLEAVQKAEIRPRVGGTIVGVHFQDGAFVKKGALLYTIDPRPFEAEAARSEAALAAAQSAASLAATELERAQSLIKNNTISQLTLDRRASDARVADANVKAAEAALRTARLNLEYTHVTAPIAGKAGRAEITVGNLVESGFMNAPVLTTIVTADPIYANIEMDEQSFLSYVRDRAVENSKAQQIPVFISLGDNDPAPRTGFIKAFDNQLDTSSGTIRVRAELDNPDGNLVPGMFVKVRMGAAMPREAVLITDRAISTDQSKKFVLVLGEGNKAMYREVTLGGTADGMRIIESGLAAGEKIIVNGLQRVQPGMPVVPETVTMEAADTTPVSGPVPQAAQPEQTEAPPAEAPPDAQPDEKPAPESGTATGKAGEMPDMADDVAPTTETGITLHEGETNAGADDLAPVIPEP
ncbi:MAG: efflux RND transporter periplasmic adaptor subunit [Alphaproteobacteria bacterium]|nr:efflux RND transporter periplasmic adaptor subunit [Alphaproteobacteria bacterium]